MDKWGMIAFKKKIQQTSNDLEKCLGIKKEKDKDLRLILMVESCEDREDHYDMFKVQNIDYNKTMGHKSKYALYLEEETTLKEDKKFRDANLVASFWLMQFPGCCGMALSTAAFVSLKYRDKGIGTILNKLRIEIARFNGYSALVCTAVDGITPKILLKNGWSETFNFVNKRTGNHIRLYSINL